jgi:hypothetical protein
MVEGHSREKSPQFIAARNQTSVYLCKQASFLPCHSIQAPSLLDGAFHNLGFPLPQFRYQEVCFTGILSIFQSNQVDNQC